ncbi:MAG: DUF1566 domain-containing protein [Aestuariibacter sp.]|nr:DUF1566 domain-containing protein [Aestuariibacter sp.]
MKYSPVSPYSRIPVKTLVVFSLSSLLIACGGGSSSNVAPSASAGADQTVNELTEDTVTLNGTASSDSDGSIVSYSWAQTAGSPTVTLSDDTVASPTFATPDITGDTSLTFELTVTDDEGATASDTTVVTITDFTARLNDTGLTWGGNYPDGNNGDCIGETIAEQDCSHGRDATHNDNSDGHAGFSFTKLDASGNDLAASASSWSCVRDNVTGLVWEVKTDDDGIHDRDNTYRWGGIGADPYGTEFYDDWDVLVNDSNTETLCGFSDWRVPNVKELKGIASFDRSSPAIDTNYFPNTSSSYYWSGTAYADFSGGAWGVNFDGGETDLFGRGDNLYVRLVRGGQ